MKLGMARDIDRIIERLKAEIPDIHIVQLQVGHPRADDDGLWFIEVPGHTEKVQVESSNGECPFLIESDFSTASSHGHSVEEVISMVRRLYA